MFSSPLSIITGLVSIAELADGNYIFVNIFHLSIYSLNSNMVWRYVSLENTGSPVKILLYQATLGKPTIQSLTSNLTLKNWCLLPNSKSFSQTIN